MLAALLGSTLFAACDLPTVPASSVATVRFDVTEPEDTSVVRVLRKVNFARLELAKGDFVHDTIVAARVAHDTVQIRVAVAVPPGPDPLSVHAELREFSILLFEGDAVLQPGLARPARVLVRPIPAYIIGPSTVQTFESLGAGLQLWSTVHFANGDQWFGQEATWVSDNPSVIEVESGNRAAPRANGTAQLIGTYRDLDHSIAVRVAQIPGSLWELAPSDTTVTVGDTVRLRLFGEDLQGYPLLPGAQVSWTFGGGVVVDELGLLTATMPGSAFARASSGSLARTAHFTVIAPPDP